MDDLTGETYIEALAPQFGVAEFEAFVRDANASGRYEYFPRLAELRQDILDARQSNAVTRGADGTVKGLIPADTRTPEQRQADAVETSRRLREIIRDTVGDDVKPRVWPKAGSREPIPVNVTDERLAELRRQAEAITEPEAVKP